MELSSHKIKKIFILSSLNPQKFPLFCPKKTRSEKILIVWEIELSSLKLKKLLIF